MCGCDVQQPFEPRARVSRKVKSINAPIEFQPRDPKLAVITSEPMNIIDQLPSNHNRLFSI